MFPDSYFDKFKDQLIQITTSDELLLRMHQPILKRITAYANPESNGRLLEYCGCAVLTVTYYEWCIFDGTIDTSEYRGLKNIIFYGFKIY